MRNDPQHRYSYGISFSARLAGMLILALAFQAGCTPPGTSDPQNGELSQLLGSSTAQAPTDKTNQPPANDTPEATLDPQNTDLQRSTDTAAPGGEVPQAPVAESSPDTPPAAPPADPAAATPPLRTLSGGSGVAPIARWDLAPYQRVNAGETLNAGVVAFSKYGISKVAFSIGNLTRNVTTMTYNPQSGVYEYCLPVSADSFSTDGRVTVEATVYGADGGKRTLPGLDLVVNPKGTLAQAHAWVSTSGNDDAGAVNQASQPFRTIGGAMKAIQAWMGANGLGSKLDGGVIHLNPGTHTADNANIWSEMPTSNEWVTITTADGGNVDNTVLRSDSGFFLTGKLAIRGITLDRSDGGGVIIDSTGSFGPGQSVWCDRCRMIGAGQWTKGSSLLGVNIGTVYMTECAISNCDYPTLNSNATKLARGLAIQHISNDAFQNVPMVVNCTVDDIDPGSTGAHADCIGDWLATGEQSRIVYNLRATNLHYQGIWNNQDSSYSSPLQGYAFVNVSLQLVDPIRSGGGGSAYAFGTDHLLFWNCTFSSRTSSPNSHVLGLYVDGSPRQQTNMTNVSVVGCVFGYSHIQDSPMLSVDMSDWSNNHYGQGDFRPGEAASSGDPMLDKYGQPMAGSPLLGRLNELVTPADALGRLRTIPGAVGAFQP